MPPRDWTLRIRDILEAIDRIADYTKEMAMADFSADTKTQDAILRNITVIGEAARAVPQEVADRHAEIPWADMRDMRN